MSAYYSGVEYIRALDQIIEALDCAKAEIKARRETVAKEPHEYSFPEWRMSKAHAVLGNALALGRSAREATT